MTMKQAKVRSIRDDEDVRGVRRAKLSRKRAREERSRYAELRAEAAIYVNGRPVVDVDAHARIARPSREAAEVIVEACRLYLAAHGVALGGVPGAAGSPAPAPVASEPAK